MLSLITNKGNATLIDLTHEHSWFEIQDRPTTLVAYGVTSDDELLNTVLNTALSGYLPLTGGTITGSLTVNGGITTSGINEADDDLSHLRLRLESITKPDFNVLIVSETSRNSKDYGRYGHDGQQGRIGQRRSLLQHTLSREETDSQHHLLQHLQPQEPEGRDVTLRDAPDVLLEESDNLFYLCCHILSNKKRKHCRCKPGSVPLLREACHLSTLQVTLQL